MKVGGEVRLSIVEWSVPSLLMYMYEVLLA